MDKGKKQTLIPKILCVLLSFGLWLYVINVENPVRTYDVKNIPVELTNIDTLKSSKFSLVKNQKFMVDLKIEGPSTEVVNVKKNDFRIVADMSSYALKEGENTIPVQILAYPENVSIKNNGYLGIKVNLERYESKQVAITSNVKLSYKEHIYEKNMIINPSKITISGGKSEVDKVAKAVLVGEQKNIDSDVTNTYSIKLIGTDGKEIHDVETNVDSSKLTIEVSKGKTVPVKLNTIGVLPSGYQLQNFELSRSYVKITGDDAILDSIKEINTEPVDISNLTESKEIQTNINIPHGIYLKDSDDKVIVKLNVTKESPGNKEIICNVKYTNLSENFIMQSSTENIKVLISGLKTDIDDVNSNNINVNMDLSKVNEEGTFTYTPTVNINGNDKVTVSDVGNVEVTIKKKQ